VSPPERLFPDRGLDAAQDEAATIYEQAKAEHNPTKTFLLFSGGNDSLVLLDLLWPVVDAVVHINTGIGIPEAHEWARKTAALYPRPFIELEPPDSYESLVLTNSLWDGLPGPGFHNIVYQRLKERCIRRLIADHRTYPGERFLLLSGIRRAESSRRKQRKEAIERDGGRVFCKPLFSWSNAEMREYREAAELPVNPVAANLHMSGECLCGAMANQDEARSERAAIRFFYPDFDARLTALENECKLRGLSHCEWGVKRADVAEDDGGDLCQSCAFRQESLFASGASK
jgi:3'-phosphoadenosine 5'-phosphosulfate sulfotransferase (PAPS reductase)/FAD synthetase